MGAEKLALIEEEQPEEIGDSLTTLKKTLTDEIIIAICGQLGTNLKLVTKNLEDILRGDYAYEVEIINLSEFLNITITSRNNEYERIVEGMKLGNELRENHSTHILADYAISEISKSRFKETEQKNIDKVKFNSRRKCFIINSLKHPEEYELLREVYGSTLYLLGVFSPYEDRENTLKKSFKRQYHCKIQELINRDTGEDLQTGQKVEDVFVYSDYFIRTYEKDEKLETRLETFLNLIFDYKINTPTIEERAMYQASSASVNSACLSRQVGACITDKKGNILATGWNEVPSANGGVYQDGQSNDYRCFKYKECTNSKKKESINDKIISSLINEEIIKEEQKKKVYEILKDKNNGLKNLIEFARSIHAEMHAIIIGSQKTGDKMIGGKLFCTTYPCHNCARHIVLAGIKEVYYIEPYRKSLCLELHSDAITEKESDKDDKVKILMYEGVAPKMFMKFYQSIKDDRKEKVKNDEDRRDLSPKHRISLRALHEKEGISVKYLEEKNLIKNLIKNDE
jgi:deoxycytidylate deaminase